MISVDVKIETLDDVDEEDGVTFGGRVFINGNLAYEYIPSSKPPFKTRDLDEILLDTIVKLGAKVEIDGRRWVIDE
jgi:hypothetical protein